MRSKGRSDKLEPESGMYAYGEGEQQEGAINDYPT